MPTKLVFWNCGVAVPAGGKPKRTAAEAANAIELAFGRGADLVAVCEVDQESFTATRKHLRDAGLRIGSSNLTKRAGKRSFWDLGLLYRTSALEVNSSQILGVWEGESVRVAVRINVHLASSGLQLRLYIAHWRSKMWSSDDHRREAARLLRNHITRDLGKNTPVVVLADFNLEPFHEDLVNGLATSRDPRLVLRYPKEKLFNPTWAWAAPPATNPWHAFGSISYKNTRWLFDQALTSSHFLDDAAGLAPAVSIVSPPLAQKADHDLLELTLP